MAPQGHAVGTLLANELELLPHLLLLDLLKVAHLDEPARLLLLNDQAKRLGSPALSRQDNAAQVL